MTELRLSVSGGINPVVEFGGHEFPELQARVERSETCVPHNPRLCVQSLQK
jgi:hypothetical protein